MIVTSCLCVWFQQAIDDFYEKISDSKLNGAVFMAVCRGKVGDAFFSLFLITLLVLFLCPCPAVPAVQKLYLFIYLQLYCPIGISPIGNSGHFPHGKLAATVQPTVHAGCYSVSIIHRTLTWTTGSLTCAQTLMHAFAHGGVQSP